MAESEVMATVKRGNGHDGVSTGAAILEEAQALYGAKKGAPRKVLDYWERLEAEDSKTPRVSPSRWDGDLAISQSLVFAVEIRFGSGRHCHATIRSHPHANGRGCAHGKEMCFPESAIVASPA